MAVKDYSLKKDGNKSISKNFKVREFKCNDNSDIVQIDDELITVLQKIRDNFNKATYVISGYRTVSYNTSIKGASRSQHMYGKAADIRISGVSPRIIAEYAETLKVGGLGLYEYPDAGGFVHVDVRITRARWLRSTRDGIDESVKGFYPQKSDIKKGIVITQGSNLNVRQYPSVTSKVIGKLPNGSTVEVIGVLGNWYKIKAVGIEGYVYAKYINLQ